MASIYEITKDRSVLEPMSQALQMKALLKKLNIGDYLEEECIFIKQNVHKKDASSFIEYSIIINGKINKLTKEQSSLTDEYYKVLLERANFVIFADDGSFSFVGSSKFIKALDIKSLQPTPNPSILNSIEFPIGAREPTQYKVLDILIPLSKTFIKHR